jgi:hypothetical protein
MKSETEECIIIYIFHKGGDKRQREYLYLTLLVNTGARPEWARSD